MSVRAGVVLVVIGLTSLVGVGMWAQTQDDDRKAEVLRELQRVLPQQRVISGSDFGFRVERQDRDGTPLGRLVVRVNGQWVEAGFAVGIVKAGTN